jgi:hypothetical protein
MLLGVVLCCAPLHLFLSLFDSLTRFWVPIVTFVPKVTILALLSAPL